VRIRRSKKIKTPDAIIAATALANGFTIFALVGVFAKNRKNRVVSDYQTVTNKIYSFDCFRMSR
jgi:predicted nucleic acid-binding protein